MGFVHVKMFLSGDGFLNFDEFTDLLRDFVPRDDSDLIRQAFQLIDLDGTGKINSQKLKRFLVSLGAKITDAYVEDVIREIDSNGNGEVGYSGTGIVLDIRSRSNWEISRCLPISPNTRLASLKS